MAPVPPVLAFLNVGTQQILFLLILVLLLFGAHKIPEFARALGRAQREFQRARDEVQNEIKEPRADEEKRVRQAAKELGIPTEGKTVRELKAEIAAHVAKSDEGATPGTPSQ